MGKYGRGRRPLKTISAEKVLRDLNSFMDGESEPTAAAEGQFRRWTEWAAARGHPAMPAHPSHLTAFFRNLARRGLAIATVKAYAGAISRYHREMELEDPVTPEVRKQISNLRRKHGSAPKRPLAKLTAVDLAIIRESAYEPRRGETAEEAAKRARLTVALISLMRDALLKPRDAVRVRRRDIRESADGTGELLLEQQLGDLPDRRSVSAATMRALADLPNEAGTDAPIFTMGISGITDLIREAAEHAGLGPDYNSLSPRFGMAADMVMAGATLLAVMAAGRWRDNRALRRHLRQEIVMRGAAVRYSRKRRRS